MGDPVSTQTLSDLITGGAEPPPKVKVSAIRAKYPMYNDMSDDQLLTAVHQKLYPEMTARQFYGGLDYDTDRAKYDPTKDMNGGQTTAAGAGKAVADTWGGIKRIGNMVGIGDYDQKAAQQDAAIDAPLMNTTGGKVGNLAGNVALTALPVGAGTRAVTQGITRAASVLPRAVGTAARFAAPTAAAAATGAATGALQNPADMEQGAELGAAFGGGGSAIGRGATAAAGGVIAKGVTPEARALMDQGVRVPFWQAQQSGIIRGLGERAKGLPIVGEMMRNSEARAGQDWNRIVQKGATPPTPNMDDTGAIRNWTTTPPKEVGQEGLQELADKYRSAYGAMYDNRVLPVPAALQQNLDGVVANARAYTPGIADEVEGAARQASDTLGVGVSPTVTNTVRGGLPLGSGRVSANIRTPVQTTTTTQLNHAGATSEQFQSALDGLDKRIGAAWKDGQSDQAEALQALRDHVADVRFQGLPPEVQSELAPVNAAYQKFLTLQKAAGTIGAARKDGVVSPGQLVNAIRARDMTPNKSAFARGTAIGQQDAQNAQSVLGSHLPEVGPGTAEKMALMGGFGAGWMLPAVGIGTALLTRPGQRFLQGGYGWQAAARNNPDALAQMLRTGGVAGADTFQK